MYNDKTKVIYIAGSGRNGSTLLARLLGQMDGFLSIGEATRYLFDEKMVSKDIPCGCGQLVSDCEFWKDIISNVNIPDEVRSFATTRVRMRYIPTFLLQIKHRSFKANLQQLITIQTAFFKAIKRKSNCDVIVDASKNPATAFLLSMIPSIDLYVIHLVRDVRGFVSSWSTSKEYLRAFPIHTTMFWWISYNIYSEFLRFYSSKYILLRYEDFVRNPGKTLMDLAEWIGEDIKDISFINNSQAKIDVQHLLGSNPDKLSNEPVYIRNQRWHLPVIKKLIVSMVTFPFLVKYGYIFNRIKSSDVISTPLGHEKTR
jgi:hypothetical protein